MNAVILPLYGISSGSYDLVHTLEHTVPLAGLAALASHPQASRKLRSVFCSVGLLTAAAVLVHLTGGLIEAHFYFFVFVVALTLYEDWLPFLVAVAYVLLHHGVLGTVDPYEVYNQPEAWANPWRWAGIHALFVGLAGIAGIIAWRLNESVRDKMVQTQVQLARLSETDSLTGLANRRKAIADLEACFAGDAGEHVLVILDLDGFKAYNDLFGHPAGDVLLTRLGHRLDETTGPRDAYRLGGDEFCVIARGSEGERATLEASCAAALADQGHAFSIRASYGSVLLPHEADNPSEAMRLADQRMYARKNSSRTTSAEDQSKDVLLRAMIEHNPDLGDHVAQVRELVMPLATALPLDAYDLQAVSHAAELHDVGKVAVPDAILNKAGPPNDEEWEFIRRHTLIGQRIVEAAPALAGVGEIIRSSHERWDGKGYPDQLAGEEIPLCARIIAVCDAYHAMTTDRPYRRALSHGDALAELQRWAGSQFDPAVVQQFEAVWDQRSAPVTNISALQARAVAAAGK